MQPFLIPSHIQGLIFDIDGTLADTMPAHYRACLKVARKYNFEFPLEYFIEMAGIPTKDVFRDLFTKQGITSLSVDHVSELKEQYYLEEVPSLQPIPFTMDIVRTYAGKLPMSMGTGGTKEIAIPNVSQIQVAQYIPILVTAEDVSLYKPFPDTFLECAKRMGIEPQYCLVFEDAINGFKAAEAAGMEWIDVTKYHSPQYIF